MRSSGNPAGGHGVQSRSAGTGVASRVLHIRYFNSSDATPGAQPTGLMSSHVLWFLHTGHTPRTYVCASEAGDIKHLVFTMSEAVDVAVSQKLDCFLGLPFPVARPLLGSSVAVLCRAGSTPEYAAESASVGALRAGGDGATHREALASLNSWTWESSAWRLAWRKSVMGPEEAERVLGRGSATTVWMTWRAGRLCPLH